VKQIEMLSVSNMSFLKSLVAATLSQTKIQNQWSHWSCGSAWVQYMLLKRVHECGIISWSSSLLESMTSWCDLVSDWFDSFSACSDECVSIELMFEQSIRFFSQHELIIACPTTCTHEIEFMHGFRWDCHVITPRDHKTEFDDCSSSWNLCLPV
jgi:hypothetical protein